MRGNSAKPTDILSLPLGSIRMTNAFIDSDPASRKDIKEIAEAVQQALKPYLERFSVDSQTQIFLSSGTAEAAAAALSPFNTAFGNGNSDGKPANKTANSNSNNSNGNNSNGSNKDLTKKPASQPEAAQINGVQFSVNDLGKLLDEVRSLKASARAKVAGLEKRADTIVAGLTVLQAALEMLGASKVAQLA